MTSYDPTVVLPKKAKGSEGNLQKSVLLKQNAEHERIGYEDEEDPRQYYQGGEGTNEGVAAPPQGPPAGQTIFSHGGTFIDPQSMTSLRHVSKVISDHIQRGERRDRQSSGGKSSYQTFHFQNERKAPSSNHMTREKEKGSSSEKTGLLSGLFKRAPKERSSSGFRGLPLPCAVKRVEFEAVFEEENFISKQYKYNWIRVNGGMVPLTSYAIQEITQYHTIPTQEDVFKFMRTLFDQAELSAECAIVSLVYVERLMKHTGLHLLARNWRPITMCGLLLASKVWQDLSSWNVEFASAYPCYTLESINRLERCFLKHIAWELYIGTSQYAQYYFALRSISGKDFRRNYNERLNLVPPNSHILQERSEKVSASIKHSGLLAVSL